MQNLRKILGAFFEENYNRQTDGQTNRQTWAITKFPSDKPGVSQK